MNGRAAQQPQSQTRPPHISEYPPPTVKRVGGVSGFARPSDDSAARWYNNENFESLKNVVLHHFWENLR